jgi:hypothetical protein
MAENPFEIDIRVMQSDAVMTPYAGHFLFFQMCNAMKLQCMTVPVVREV